MIPPTAGGLAAFEVLSALQKHIRRAEEREAMQMAVELHRTSKAFATMVCNRLQVVSHEDIDSAAAPWIVPYVATATAQAMLWHDPAKLGRSLMPVANCIRLMCRAPKSRFADHCQAASRLAAELEGFVPTVPDWTRDQHTYAGRAAGRGLDYFRAVSAVLVPPPAEPDPYQDEAFRLWALKVEGTG